MRRDSSLNTIFLLCIFFFYLGNLTNKISTPSSSCCRHSETIEMWLTILKNPKAYMLRRYQLIYNFKGQWKILWKKKVAQFFKIHIPLSQNTYGFISPSSFIHITNLSSFLSRAFHFVPNYFNFIYLYRIFSQIKARHCPKILLLSFRKRI